MRRAVVLVTLLLAAPAAAQPVPQAGSGGLCTGFDETHEGVWLDEEGAETLLFRFARNGDGAGCYAWLNAAPEWGIPAGGAFLAEVRADGPLRVTGTVAEGARGVSVNLATGEALFAGGGPLTRGRLTSDR